MKKEHGSSDNEFLLITDRMVIDIRGDIKIKTIYEMEEMVMFLQQPMLVPTSRTGLGKIPTSQPDTFFHRSGTNCVCD
jgi:hypothetical protein